METGLEYCSAKLSQPFSALPTHARLSLHVPRLFFHPILHFLTSRLEKKGTSNEMRGQKQVAAR
jgi:hypothetical protein